MKKGFKFLLFLFIFLAFPVLADDGKLYQAGDNFTLSSEMAGTSFVAGNNVTTANNVDGILFSAGNFVTNKSKSDYAFIAGNEVIIEDASFKDGFIAGSGIRINSSNIERDLYVAGATISLNSNVGRNAYLAASDVTINGQINGDLTIYAANITIDSDTVVTGTLKYADDSVITISENATINNKEVVKGDSKKLVTMDFKSSLLDALSSFINALLVAVVIILLFPKIYEAIASKGKDKILSNIGFGLLFLLFVPFVSIMVIITVAGLSLGLLMLDFYFVAICLSTIISSYYYGNLIFKNKINNKYLLTLVTLLIIYLLKLIPFVGGLLSLVCLTTGLGLIVSLIRRK